MVTKTVWKNGEAGGTPLNATNLNNTEDNAFAGASLADTATVTGRAVLSAANAAAARTAIGAGTSSVKVGTGATDAKAGNYTPTATQTTANAIEGVTGNNVQTILESLAADIKLLKETP